MVAVRILDEAPRFTEREYLALESVAEIKHEYVNGEILAMAGAELAHNQIVQNLRFELGRALEAKPCRVIGGDQRVKVETSSDYLYPDVVVVCAEPHIVGEKPRSLTNPEIVVEVLSPSTARYDRGAKWGAYQRIPSLNDYVLVSASQALVEHYQRGPDDSWTLRRFGPGQTLHLGHDITIEVDRLYRLVDFDAPAND